jgi:hypothetical protein
MFAARGKVCWGSNSVPTRSPARIEQMTQCTYARGPRGLIRIASHQHTGTGGTGGPDTENVAPCRTVQAPTLR